jgi:hypothetical protein
MWLMLLGVLIVIALAVVIQQVILPAVNWTQDQWNYGNSRITQLDANVGHGGESHFIALYSKGEIVVMEMSIDHPNHYQVYTLTGMVSVTGTPVILLSVEDLKHDGKLDLIVQVKGSSFQMVLYNAGTGFSTNEE